MILTFLSQPIAQRITNPALSPTFQALSGWDFFNRIIPSLVQIAFVIGVVIFFFMLVLGAIGWITSGGDKVSLETAKRRVTNGLTGLAVLLSIFALVKIVNVLFGINIGNLGS